MIEVRPFTRGDREQLARLVNAHVAAAMPGASVPTATLLNDLERPIGEYVVGPWVTDMATLVAVEGDRIVAGAHLRRYGGEEGMSESYRDAGEITWLVCWPGHLQAGRALTEAALEQLARWQVRICYGDGTLPAPGVFGVPNAWPHVRSLYEGAGFDPNRGQREIILVGSLDDIAPPGEPPLAGVTLGRQLGSLGTAFNAIVDGEVVGSFEVDDDLTRGGTNLSFAGWADEANHWVRHDLRNHGVGSWLVASAASWLRLGGKSRLMVYVIDGENAEAQIAYYARYGLQPISRTTRGWQRAA